MEQLHNFDKEGREWISYDSSLSRVQPANSLVQLKASTTMDLDDYQLLFVAPIIENWCLLGERHKFVPLSSRRFVRVEVSALTMKLELEGSRGETVELAYACRDEKSKEYNVYSRSITIPPSGFADVTLERSSACMEDTDDEMAIETE